MKFALTILCSLLFLGGQMAAVALPMGCAGQTAKPCACGGKMACCATSPASIPQTPATAAVPAGSPQQIWAFFPVVVGWGLVPAGTPSNSPTTSVSLKAGDAPIFARHCAWII